MDVTIHLGAHRCGTTTLQKYLAQNQTPLADAGVVAWGPGKTRSGLFAGLVHRPSAVTPDLARRGHRSCGVIATEIDALHQAGYRDLLVSDENMIGALGANIKAAAFYPDIAARLHRFVPGFGENPRRIVLSVRAYHKYWASAFNFWIARGHPLPTLARLDQIVQQPRRWRDVIRTVAEVFPRTEIIVWPFERYAGQPEKQLSLMTNGLHIAPALAARRQWFNQSRGRAELRRIIADRQETSPLIATLQGEGAWSPFSAPQVLKMRQDYAQDLAWLRAGADGNARFVEDIVTVAPQKDDAKSITTRGFVATDRTWVSQEGRQNHGTEKIVV